MSLVRIEVSTAAVLANLEELRRRHPGRLAVDLGRDAWGHGAAEALAVLVDAGVTVVTARSRDERAALSQAVPSRPGLSRAIQVLAHDDLAEEEVDAVVGPELFGLGGGIPALSLYARLARTKTVAAGEGVSYGHTYVTSEPTVLALVGLGYSDGLDRRAGNRVRVGIAGAAVPLVGRVAMNVAVAALGAPGSAAAEAAREGDEVLVLGGAAGTADPLAAVTTSAWATALGTPGAAVTARLARRIPRRWGP